MASAIADSSCLIALERIGRLDILQLVFSDVAVPLAVRDEFGRSPAWLTVRPVRDQLLNRSLRSRLDHGEAEVIALAAESETNRLLLDDKKARRIAREMELRPLGTVGLLVRAKRAGVIDECKPVLNMLMDADFRISESLYQEALKLAGEFDEW